jgi:hypothetical protein
MVEAEMSQNTISERTIIRVASDVANQSGGFLVYAQCPDGYVPLAGGLYANNLVSQMMESYPDYVNNRWYVRAYTYGTISVTVYVTCIKSS